MAAGCDSFTCIFFIFTRLRRESLSPSTFPRIIETSIRDIPCVETWHKISSYTELLWLRRLDGSYIYATGTPYVACRTCFHSCFPEPNPRSRHYKYFCMCPTQYVDAQLTRLEFCCSHMINLDSINSRRGFLIHNE